MAKLNLTEHSIRRGRQLSGVADRRRRVGTFWRLSWGRAKQEAVVVTERNASVTFLAAVVKVIFIAVLAGIIAGAAVGHLVGGPSRSIRGSNLRQGLCVVEGPTRGNAQSG
jgi:hypothetical protein